VFFFLWYLTCEYCLTEYCSFFVEDGVEMNNVFDRNLVIEQLSSPGPIRSDSEPACFWTASPANIWRNNVCAGWLRLTYFHNLSILSLVH